MEKKTLELVKEMLKDPNRIGFIEGTSHQYFLIEPFLIRQMVDELKDEITKG